MKFAYLPVYLFAAIGVWASINYAVAQVAIPLRFILGNENYRATVNGLNAVNSTANKTFGSQLPTLPETEPETNGADELIATQATELNCAELRKITATTNGKLPSQCTTETDANNTDD
jgi:hypothetical protein